MPGLRVAVAGVVFSLTSLSCNCDSSVAPDAGATDGGAVGVSPAYAIVVTQSPAGPGNGAPSTWGGVLQYELPRDGGQLRQISGIDAGLLHDPVAVVYRAATRELFVANRHGNNSADGVAGSISVFAYSSATRDFTPEPPIVGNWLSGVHQVAFNPVTGELFAANVNSGISRFVFVDGGAVANGTISDGPVRGVLIANDGTHLFHTAASNVIRQFPLDGGPELPPLVIPGNPNLHFFDARGDTIFVCGLDSQRIYRLKERDGGLELIDSFAASSPVSVRVDLSGDELYVSGHRNSDVLQRFELDAGQWDLRFDYPTTSSLGGIELLP